MSTKWTTKYSSAAVATATIIILIALIANPPTLQTPPFDNAHLAIILTDPPTVPAGTAKLGMTYYNIQLHVAYPNETIEWLPVNASGTVNLLSLLDMTQTLTNTTIPTSSTIDKIQFSINDIEAIVNETIYNVSILSNTLMINIANGYVNSTLSGILIDFAPTLVQIEANDADGALVNYYALVPSANAILVEDLTESQMEAGNILKLEENHKIKLANAAEELKKNVNIVSASLTIKDDITSLAVTLQNEGNNDFQIIGALLHGEFKTTQTHKTQAGKQDQSSVKIHPQTIPFKMQDTSLIPLPGTLKQEDKHETPDHPEVTIEPGETFALTFADVISVQSRNENRDQTTIITPIIDSSYRLKLVGQGFQSIDIMATP